MLNQLQFKLQVEEQYKLGIEKMAQAYRAEGDKRLRNETDAKRIESDGKIQLLRKAKKRYETLAKFGGGIEDEDGGESRSSEQSGQKSSTDHFLDLAADGKRKEALRKPISGKLVISLRSARDLNHRALPRKSSKVYNETTVVIKIEGNERAVSHPSRNDRWLEDFEISVDKANEVELTIYDSVAPGDSAPIGMLWLRVSDLMEAVRRQKVGMEGQGAGWVTADKAATMGPRQGSAQDSMSLHSSGTLRVPPSQGGDNRLHEGIDGWWSVEPAGAISLKLDFGKLPFPITRCQHADRVPSQGHCRRWSPSLRGSWPTGCRPKAQGRRVRNERPQIRSTTVLPAHHVCALSGVSPHRRRIPVRGLPICLSQKVLPESRHQVYLEVERRRRKLSAHQISTWIVAHGCRRATRRRSIIAFRTGSAATRTCRQTGAVTAVTCCRLDERTRSSARNARSRAIRHARTWYRTSAG